MGKIIKYTPDELVNLKITKEVLVRHWLHRGECLFAKAQKKVGKSLFAQNFAHCCSAGTPLFGDESYDIPKPLKVAYLFSEGALVDWKERIINMNKMYQYNNNNLFFVQCNFLKLYTEEDMQYLLDELISLDTKFDLIIWDCLYKFIFGRGVNDEVTIGCFNANEEYIRNHFNAASIILHHDSEKKMKDQKGREHSAASNGNAMGHSFLLAHPTQIYTMTKYKNEKGIEERKITLGDKRSGDLVEELILRTSFPEYNDDGMLGITTCDEETSGTNYDYIKTFIESKPYHRMLNLHNRAMEAQRFQCSYETFRRIINKLIKEKHARKVKVDGYACIEKTQN